MKLNGILQHFHEYITTYMYNNWIVNNILIATVEEDDGLEYDCIYCTILRVAVLFTLIGAIVGLLLGYLLWG